ncbi:MAG TPA: DUF116 domain-containing protein [Bacillota bacterium]|nr:DUF116 domain-containing protein [Bacillota bacterium]
METLTYQLIDTEENSLEYYKRASYFCDQVLTLTDRYFSELTADFQRFIVETSREQVRTKAEYQLEILVIGTLWRIYAQYLKHSNPVIEWALTGLASARQRNSRLKPWMDWTRGVLITFWLGNPHSDIVIDGREPLSVRGFTALVRWLNATGDFEEEIIRLQSWLAYFRARPETWTADVMASIQEWAVWFARESGQALGQYTAGVESFLSSTAERYHFREDRIFCRRRSEEYYLNMVGAEIMNRAFRKEFQSKKRKIVFLPVCLRYNLGASCRWREGELGFVCGHCQADCQINQVTRMGKEEGFEVYIIPHESSLTTGELRKSEGRDDIGVVGVACVLNLMSGGWKIKGLGIPAQCVLLDYCGCKAHWHERGIVTAMNIDRLREIMHPRKNDQ